MLPHFIIIGTQKSATTFLHICLNDHPDIFLPKEEIPFFETPHYERNSIRSLENIFDGKENYICGIKRPSYLGRSEVAGRIKKHLPEAKTIVILRNPVNRAISAYYHQMRYGFIPVENIESGMRKILHDQSFLKKYKRAHEIIDFGYYYDHLKRYEKYIYNDKMLIITHKDLCVSPLTVIQSVYSFLNVFSEYVPESLSKKPQKVMYNINRLKFLRKMNTEVLSNDKIIADSKNNFYFLRMMRMLIKIVDQAFLSLFMPNKKPDVSKELIDMLFNKYKDDICKLEYYLGKSFSHWKR